MRQRPSLDEIFAEPISAESAAPKNRPSLDEIFAEPEDNVISKISKNLDENRLKSEASGARLASGNQTLPENLAQGLDQAVGVIGSVASPLIGAAGKFAYDKLTTQGFKDRQKLGLESLANTDVGKKGIQALQKGQQAWSEYEKQNPRDAANLHALFTASTMGFGKAVPKATNEAVDLAGNAIKNVAGDVTEGMVNKIKPLPAIPTSEAVKDVAKASYKEADNLGGVLRPENSAKFIDNLESLKKQTKWGQATTGEDAITSLLDRYTPLRNEPISLQAAQEIDEGLGQLIDGFYDAKGKINKEGLKVQKAQQAFRDMIEATPENEIVGGKEGFDAWKRGQKEWSTAVRLAEMERIIARAETMDNPATSLKAGFRMLERTGMRGYSAEEKKAIRHAARSGFVGGTLRTVLGSRLIGTGLGLAVGGAGMNPLTAAAGAAAGAAQSGLSRKAAESLAMGRVNKARRVVAKRLPKDVGKLPPREALKVLNGEN